MCKCPSLPLPFFIYREKGKGTYRYVLTLPYIQIPILRKTYLKKVLIHSENWGDPGNTSSIKLVEIELDTAAAPPPTTIIIVSFSFCI